MSTKKINNIKFLDVSSVFELVQRPGHETSVILTYTILLMKNKFKTILTSCLILISMITMNAQQQKRNTRHY